MISRIRTLSLCCTVVVLSSVFALAQSDPMAPPASATQPNQPRQVPPSATSMQDSNTGGDTVQRMRDQMFLRKAAEGGIAEVQLGKLAAEKGASEDVRTFGQKMVDDHTKLNDQMSAIADALGVMLPKTMNKTDQAEYDKLNALAGDDFDKEYINAMVKDHHTDLREFRIEANATTNPTLGQAVSDGAHVIHEHMVMIDKIARSKGIATPASHAHATPPPTN